MTYTWDAKAQVENGGKTNIWKADNLVDGTLINKICPDKYFVFDLNASPDPISGLGKLVCCQYTITPAITPPDTILNINSF
ncbi:MAG: hypothetical protein NTX00_02435 [Candidatus Parcubacteria bacterium]|nr:hypothetical protein [Candidatus Parcubacteria bacterium]